MVSKEEIENFISSIMRDNLTVDIIKFHILLYKKIFSKEEFLEKTKKHQDELINKSISFNSVEDFKKNCPNESFKRHELKHKEIRDKYGITTSFHQYGKNYLTTDNLDEVGLNWNRETLIDVQKEILIAPHKYSPILGDGVDLLCYDALNGILDNTDKVHMIEVLSKHFV